MNKTLAVLAILSIGVFLIGCTSGQTGYSNYNQPQQQPYVGGGCGVAPSADYEDTPAEAFDSADSAL